MHTGCSGINKTCAHTWVSVSASACINKGLKACWCAPSLSTCLKMHMCKCACSNSFRHLPSKIILFDNSAWSKRPKSRHCFDYYDGTSQAWFHKRMQLGKQPRFWMFLPRTCLLFKPVSTQVISAVNEISTDVPRLRPWCHWTTNLACNFLHNGFLRHREPKSAFVELSQIDWRKKIWKSVDSSLIWAVTLHLSILRIVIVTNISQAIPYAQFILYFAQRSKVIWLNFHLFYLITLGNYMVIFRLAATSDRHSNVDRN